MVQKDWEQTLPGEEMWIQKRKRLPGVVEVKKNIVEIGNYKGDFIVPKTQRKFKNHSEAFAYARTYMRTH